jgi:hypothetical protein
MGLERIPPAAVKLNVRPELLIALALLLFFGKVPAQIIVTTGSLKTNRPSCFYTNAPTTNLVAPHCTPRGSGEQLAQPRPLAPGVYLTKPYTCMVMVPGRQADDCMAGKVESHPCMPTSRPGLQFVPLPSLQK